MPATHSRLVEYEDAPPTKKQRIAEMRAKNAKNASATKLRQAINEHAVVVQAAPMSEAAFEELMSIMDQAGHHVGKDRGTIQLPLLLSLADGDGDLAAFLTSHFDLVDGLGKHVNTFLNINAGKGGASDRSGSEKTLGHDGGGWHVDIMTRGERAAHRPAVGQSHT